jgi:hypothetical protein
MDIKNDRADISKRQAIIKSIGHFLVFDGNGVAGFGGEPLEGSSKTLGTGSTRDVDVDLKILEGLTVTHPTGHVHMILKLLYRTIHNTRLITRQDTKLPRMERQAHIEISSQLADSGE